MSSLDTARQHAREVVSGICDIILQDYKKGSDDRLGRLSMSDMGSCERKMRYKLDGLPQTNTPPSIGSLWDGRLYHEDTQAILKRIFGDNFRSVEDKVKAKMGEAELSGHVDGVLDRDGESYLVEIKTFNDFGWRKRYDSFDRDKGYRHQLNTYLHALGLQYAIIIMRKKSFQEWDSIVIEYDPVLFKETSDSVGRVIKTPPELLPRIDPDKKGSLHWMCNYCPYLTKCWGNGIVKASPNKWRIQ